MVIVIVVKVVEIMAVVVLVVVLVLVVVIVVAGIVAVAAVVVVVVGCGRGHLRGCGGSSGRRYAYGSPRCGIWLGGRGRHCGGGSYGSLDVQLRSWTWQWSLWTWTSSWP